jgi:hypothetical protein
LSRKCRYVERIEGDRYRKVVAVGVGGKRTKGRVWRKA